MTPMVRALMLGCGPDVIHFRVSSSGDLILKLDHRKKTQIIDLLV